MASGASLGENPREEANKDCVFSTTREGSMKQVKILSAAVLLALAGAANAGVTGTLTATSDYDFRGITQSAEDPAFQASIDYAHESGWYIGAWGSNVDFCPVDGPCAPPVEDINFEIDVYTGFSGKINDDTTWDVGFIYYAYPDESDLDTSEIYGSLAYKWVKGKVSYSDDIGGTGEDGIYIEGGVNVPLPSNFSINAHVGQWSTDAFGDDYMDYSVGVGYAISNFNLGLKFVDTNRDDPADDSRVIFTVSTTLPWN
jgi:uncharacterized protein (TIGR02001 family)